MNDSLKLKTGFFAVGMLVPASQAMAQTQHVQEANFDLLYGLLIGFGVLFLIIVLVLNSVIKSMADNKELWKPKPSKHTGTMLALMLIMMSGHGSAQTAEPSFFSEFANYPTSLWMLILMNLFLIAVIGIQLRVFRKLIDSLRVQNAPEKEEPEETVIVETENLWLKNIMKKLTRTVPVEREEEVMTDHSYDGIRELDNVLPPWWVALFYLTIIFAVVYLAHYHLFKTGDLQIAEYHQSIQKADLEIEAYMATMKAMVDEKTVTRVSEAGLLADGEKIYLGNCVACHGIQGEGGVGPNFTDEYWIHGGSINDIFSVIKYGVPSKGMISWRAQLSPTEIQNVSSYLLTFQGTDPPNQKEPQGEKYVPAESDVDDSVEKQTADSVATSTSGDSLDQSLSTGK